LADGIDPAVQPDHLYSGWTLGGASGTVTLELGGFPIHSLSWTNATAGVSFQVPGTRQIQLAGPTSSANLCAATTSYGGGASMGTPGAISDCIVEGYQVDFYSDKPFID